MHVSLAALVCAKVFVLVTAYIKCIQVKELSLASLAGRSLFQCEVWDY